MEPFDYNGVLQTKVNAFPLTSFGDDVRGLQSQSQGELDALLPSTLRPQGETFKGELKEEE